MKIDFFAHTRGAKVTDKDEDDDNIVQTTSKAWRFSKITAEKRRKEGRNILKFDVSEK